MVAARISEKARFEVLTVVLLRIQVLWDGQVVMELLDCLKMKAVCSFKMLGTTTQCHSHIPEDLNPHIREDCLD
jgi:hypothetical protein